VSAPVVLACAFAAVIVGVPVISASAHLEARHRVAGAADAAALAAADALSGLLEADPCALAADVASAAGTVLRDCEMETRTGEARTVVTVLTPFGTVEARARAAPLLPPGGGLHGAVGENGWAWPSAVRGVTQGFHDGFAIDLAVDDAGLLFAPYAGVVVQVGTDGGGMPAACIASPSWWRGPNHSVMIRHDFEGVSIYSSHNHISPGSTGSLGVSVGDRVSAGQPVARAGMSGCTSGAHTHFTLSTRPENAFPDLDPFEYLGPP